MRMYADEVATNVTITTKLTINEQRSHAKIREVADVDTELPLM
jgi:hypothetical protein